MAHFDPLFLEANSIHSPPSSVDGLVTVRIARSGTKKEAMPRTTSTRHL